MYAGVVRGGTNRLHRDGSFIGCKLAEACEQIGVGDGLAAAGNDWCAVCGRDMGTGVCKVWERWDCDGYWANVASYRMRLGAWSRSS